MEKKKKIKQKMKEKKRKTTNQEPRTRLKSPKTRSPTGLTTRLKPRGFFWRLTC